MMLACCCAVRVSPPLLLLMETRRDISVVTDLFLLYAFYAIHMAAVDVSTAMLAILMIEY